MNSEIMDEPSQLPWISVIIVCHNDGKWLPRCLDSLHAQTIFDCIEVIIADNASGDGTDILAQNLIAGWPRAKLIPTGGDNGFAVACNRGAQAAHGRYLYLLNPDVWLEPDCLERLYQGVEQAQASAGSAIIYEYEDDTVQHKGSDAFDLFCYPLAPRAGHDPGRLFCINGFTFIRRDSFLRIGLLDEKMFMYAEELDLSWRLWLSGGVLVPVLAARIHHRGAALVNPAGGTRVVENRTSIQKRYLANRNCLLTITKNSQHILLLTLVNYGLLLLAEALATLIMARSWKVAKHTSLDPLFDLWRMRGHVCEERKKIKAIRQHGDFWMLRFFRPGFGRWHEIRKMFKLGFPKINRS
jgi:N-acetylglucosaminyl-diphospho-decaprenol L-rhamnosyltransferase